MTDNAVSILQSALVCCVAVRNKRSEHAFDLHRHSRWGYMTSLLAHMMAHPDKLVPSDEHPFVTLRLQSGPSYSAALAKLVCYDVSTVQAIRCDTFPTQHKETAFSVFMLICDCFYLQAAPALCYLTFCLRMPLLMRFD